MELACLITRLSVNSMIMLGSSINLLIWDIYACKKDHWDAAALPKEALSHHILPCLITCQLSKGKAKTKETRE